MAAETSAEAMVPVNLAILKMNVLMLYNTYEVCLSIVLIHTFQEFLHILKHINSESVKYHTFSIRSRLYFVCS